MESSLLPNPVICLEKEEKRWAGEGCALYVAPSSIPLGRMQGLLEEDLVFIPVEPAVSYGLKKYS